MGDELSSYNGSSFDNNYFWQDFSNLNESFWDFNNLSSYINSLPNLTNYYINLYKSSNNLDEVDPLTTNILLSQAKSDYLDYNWNNLSNPTYNDYQSLDPSVQSQVWSKLTSKQLNDFNNQKLKEENESLKKQGKKGVRGTLIPGLFDSSEKGNDLGFSSLNEAKQNRNKVFADPNSTSQEIADAKKSLKSARMNVAGQVMGVAGDILNNVLPSRPEYEGDKGALSAGLDKGYDAIADAIGMVPGWGTLVSGIMKARAGVNKLMGLIGGGTDGMTNTDAILGSSFLGLTPFGMINGFGGKRTDTFTKDNQAFALVGGSYTGSSAQADEALEHSDKKYGLFSSHQRHEANEQIAEAKRQLNIISGISDESQRRNTLRGSMSGIRSTRRAVNRSGGYNQSHTRAGRQGLKVSPHKARRLVSNVTFYLKGGSIIKEGDYLNRLILYAIRKNPRFMLRLLEKPTLFVETPDGMPGSHLLMSTDMDGYEIVFPLIQEIDGKLTYIPDYDEALDRARKNKDYLKFNSVEDADLFTEHYKEYFPEWMEEFYELTAPYLDENGRVKHEVTKGLRGFKLLYVKSTNPKNILEIEELELIDGFRQGDVLYPILFESEIIPEELELIPLFLNGGEINIIPDGALHKNLHHMEDAEHLTKKGIPVVTIDDNELVAEIETSEIILRKEITEKLEELCKLYYLKDAAKELKDECALEAGELLVDEILNNTIDKTNKLL